MSKFMLWDTVIGLEIHAQLKTKAKLFSGAANKFGQRANEEVSFIDAGLPGVLPVLNEQALIMAIQFGLAINATINNNSYFERKNYFYPDLPKGYQISQYQRPIISNGAIIIRLADGKQKTVPIERAHLEEDAGKLLHDMVPSYTGVDLNRAGIPLLEIVTTPCLTSAAEAVCTVKTLHQLLRFLKICDGNMQEGSLRCDVNISLKPHGTKVLGGRIELKNLNSFRFIEKAILYEQERQRTLLESGLIVMQQTRLYAESTGTTELLRSKENESDYRYFPDPDLLPMQIKDLDLQMIKKTLPILPEAIIQHLTQNNEITNEDLDFILLTPQLYNFLQELKLHSRANEKMLINWLKGPFATALYNDNSTFDTMVNPPVSASLLGKLLNCLVDQVISYHAAKQIFNKLWTGAENIDVLIVDATQQARTNLATIEKIVPTILAEFPEHTAQYKAGKKKLLAFFVGQVMKHLKGRADPTVISQYLQRYFNKVP